jgi:hypothetical protein
MMVHANTADDDRDSGHAQEFFTGDTEFLKTIFVC